MNRPGGGKAPQNVQGDDDTDREVGVGLGGRVTSPPQHGADVVQFSLDSPRPGELVAAFQLGTGVFAEGGVVLGVTAPPVVGLPGGGELLTRGCAESFEQPVAAWCPRR